MLQHCLNCSGNSKDAQFALAAHMPQASVNQCLPCYVAWIGLSRIWTWKEFCDKARREKPFGEKVKQGTEVTKVLLKFPDRFPGYANARTHTRQEVDDEIELGIEVYRNGIVRSSTDLCFGDNPPATEKQLGLPEGGGLISLGAPGLSALPSRGRMFAQPFFHAALVSDSCYLAVAWVFA